MSKIPVFLISDENYAMYMAATIVSIVSNTKSFVEFIVLDGGIKAETKEKIAGMKTKFDNFSIEFIKMDMEKVSNFPDIQHFSLNTYLRYFIPDLKPDINKALYIDVDMIVNTDIQALYDTELKNPIAAVPYFGEYLIGKVDTWCPWIKEHLNMKDDSKYFNAGLLLLDLDYCRKNNLTQLFVEKTNELADILKCPDQDILNIVFEKNFKELEYKYNVIIDVTTDLSREFFDRIVETNDLILHYTGGNTCRPWKYTNCPAASFFWKYAQMTPFEQQLKEQLALYEIENQKQLKKYRKKYRFYKTMSKITFGKIKQKYKVKIDKYEEKMRGLQ